MSEEKDPKAEDKLFEDANTNVKDLLKDLF